MVITPFMREAYANEVKRQARLLRRALRIRFIRVRGETYADGHDMLAAAHRRDAQGWATLYTNTDHNETPAVLNSAANLEGRELHDCAHVVLGLGFEAEEETRVTAWQRAFTPSPAVRGLLALDAHGSNEHYRVYGRFQNRAREWTSALAAELDADEWAALCAPPVRLDCAAVAVIRAAAARLGRPG